jgi:hypothetical protein
MTNEAQDLGSVSPVQKPQAASEDFLKGDHTPNKLIPGSIYNCTVKEVIKPNNTVVCSLADGTGRELDNHCVSACGTIGSLLGFKANWLPPRGTKVLVLYSGDRINYIIGSYGAPDEGDTVGLGRSVTGPDRPDDGGPVPYGLRKCFEWFRSAFLKGSEDLPNNIYDFAGKPSHDGVEGEYELTNQMGVALNLTRNLASLKAADLAKVECHIIDDMVRIISQTYKHFSAFGDYKIYNDGGRLNVRWDGTNVDWETYGQEEQGKQRSTLDTKNTNVSIPTPQTMENDSRWRFSQFVGFLGDFVNIFITDPTETVQRHPHVKHLNRSGKGRVHINEDGSMLLQTVSEIGLEKVCRIPVPLEQKPEYHPKGDKLFKTPYPPELEPLKNWNFGESGGEDNSHYNIYQIRSYVKWFSNKFSKAQFLRLKEDWKVPSEENVPEPDVKGQKQFDKQLVNNSIKQPPIETYATIRIQKDGSILLLDAYDNSVVLSKGGVQVSSSNNLQLEAAGSINMIAGRDINMTAKNNIDLNALQKGISIRSKMFFQQYCEQGGILFETDQISSNRVYETEDDPDAPHDSETRIEGIYFKTNNTSIRLEAGLDLGLKAIQGSILATPAQDFGISTGGRFQVNDTLEIWNAKTRSATDYDFNPIFNKEEVEDGDTDPTNDGLGIVKIDGMCMIAKTFTNYLVQYADDFRPMLCSCKDDDDNNIDVKECVVHPTTGKWWSKNKKKGQFCHPGHVLTTRNQMFDTVIGETKALEYKKHLSNGKFKHRTAAEYGTTGSTDPLSSEALYQTLTQQSLVNELQNTKITKTEYDFWNFNFDIVTNDPTRGAAWPGKNIKYLKYSVTSGTGNPSLWTPDSLDPKDYNNYAEALKPGELMFKHIKEN